MHGWDYRKAKRGETRCEDCQYGSNTVRWWSGRWSCTLHGCKMVGAKMTCQYARQCEITAREAGKEGGNGQP